MIAGQGPGEGQINFYKVELWTYDDLIERMLFTGTSLDKAVPYLPITQAPAARLTIRQLSRVLAQWPKDNR